VNHWPVLYLKGGKSKMAVRLITLKNGEKRYEAYFKLEGIRYQKRFQTRTEAKEWEVDEKRHIHGNQFLKIFGKLFKKGVCNF